MPDSPTTPAEPTPETHAPLAAPSAPAPAAPAPAESVPPGTTKPSRRRWLWLSLAILLVLVVAVYFVWSSMASAKAAAAAKAAAKGPPAIPVVATTSRKGDIGVYYSGLGAVTPLATVTDRTRVDGQLMSVRYREGDTVQKGDLLLEIDDGLYRAALTQAEGQLDRKSTRLNSSHLGIR